jgi:hypothetical protein
VSAYLPHLPGWVIALYTLAIGVAGGVVTELAHHKAELVGLLIAAAGWAGRRAHRAKGLVVHTGRHVAPRKPKTAPTALEASAA